MVYEPVSDEESPKLPRSPKGKEKAIDSPPPPIPRLRVIQRGRSFGLGDGISI